MSSVLLGIFSMASLQLWHGALALANSSESDQQALLAVERQLQRDEGVLRHTAKAWVLDCRNGLERQRGLQQLVAELEAAGAVPGRQISLQADQLRLEQAVAGLGQARWRLFSLEGLGACS